MKQSKRDNNQDIPFGLDIGRSHRLSIDTASEVVFLIKDDELASGWSDEMVFNDAETLYGVDAFAAAESALTHFLRRRPESVFVHEARFLLGMSLFRQNAFHRALAVFSEIVMDFPESGFRSLAGHYRRRCQSLLGSVGAPPAATCFPVSPAERSSPDPPGM